MTSTSTESGTRHRLPALRIGVLAGLTGILCCVGPTVLALLGIVSAGTAFVWANDLYDGYAWWFRLGGLLALAGLVVWSLRRRDQCTSEESGATGPGSPWHWASRWRRTSFSTP